MPRREDVAPKHRATSTPSPDRTPAKHRHGGPLRRFGVATRRGAALTAAASVVTLGAVGAGVAYAAPDAGDMAAQLQANTASAAPDSSMLDRLGQREEQVSRSASRLDRPVPVDNAKLDLLQKSARSGGQVTKTEDLGSGDPKAIAAAMLSDFGWSSDQMGCLDSLWTKESGWNPHAANPTSSAYGIPQALPGSKMATAGSDWADNPATQIEWGLGYIRDSYGSPCSAWGHSESYGWY